MAQQLADQPPILSLPQHDAALPTAAKEAVGSAVRKVLNTLSVVFDLMHDAIAIDIKNVDAGVQSCCDEPYILYVLYLNGSISVATTET